MLHTPVTLFCRKHTTNGNVSRAYTYGAMLISQTQLVGSTWTTSFYGSDGHGSIRFLMDSSGNITDTYDYDAFGILIHQTGATPNLYLYSGEQFDPDLGFYYERARYLNISTGRFWTMDSFEGGQDPESLHKYNYADADPANRVDPDGEDSLVEAVGTLAVRMTIGALAGILVNGVNNYTLGRPFFQGAKGAALFGAAALPLAAAFPILGVVLSSAGVVLSGENAWQVFSNPNSSGGQRAASIFLIGLSIFGAYGSSTFAGETSLWVNAEYLDTGGTLGSAKTGTMSGALDYIGGRVSEFSDVLFNEMPNQRGRITIGVGVAEDASGQRYTLIGTSEPAGSIRGAMKPLIQTDDIVVKGTGHAEADIVSYANARGWTIIGVGATRPICSSCAADIAAAGATAATPLK